MRETVSKLDIEKVRALIRDKSLSPEELTKRLRAMIEDAYPVNVFEEDGWSATMSILKIPDGHIVVLAVATLC